MRSFARRRANLPRRRRSSFALGAAGCLAVILMGFNVLQYFATRRLARANAAYQYLLLKVDHVDCELSNGDEDQAPIVCAPVDVPSRSGESLEEGAQVQ
ncbi:MAG TPA: hypothetical protein VHB45_13090 [Alloacidobacterium sp.]|nr:hypothetical protein [Alloacidobacterium sp.]